MSKIIKNSFGNFLVVLLIFSIVTGWIFSGWPQIWKKPSIPPKIEEVQAAIGFDAKSSGWVERLSSLTVQHTSTGSNLILIVFVKTIDTIAGDRDVTDVTYNGTSITYHSNSTIDDGVESRIEMWYKIDPVTGGTPYIVATTGGAATDLSLGAITLTGVDQSNPIDAFNTASGSTGNPSVIVNTQSNNTYLVDGVNTAQSKPGDSFSEDYTIIHVTDVGSNTHGSQYRAGGASGNHTMSYTENDNNMAWIISAVSIKEAVVAVYPTFDSGQEPHEDPEVHNGTGTAGTAGNPVNVGSDVTFKATATDGQNDNWTLLVCKTDGVTGIACDDGAGDTYCTSGSTTSTEEAYCTYTALVGDTESNAWYAYACDASSCSPNSNSGTSGNNGTPFYVNHGASFTVVTDLDDPSVPGGTVTITTEADDLEGAEADDTLSLYICKTQSATASGCGGGEWCHDTSSKTSDPTCNWIMNVAKTGDLTANQCEGNYNYYAYIFDNHGFAASTAGSKQGFVFTNTVDNVVPEVTAVSLNLGSDFTPDNEEATKNITVTGTVKDDNGCVDVDDATTADVSIYYYKSAVTGYTECDDSPGAEDDNNYCYSIRDCAYDADTCTGTTDSDATFTCTVAIQYHANPTDGASSGDSTWWDYTWRATLIGSDGDLSHTLESTDIEMISVMAYDVDNGSATIEYTGPLAPEETSVSATNTVEATGNVGLDVNLYSSNANMCTVDFPTCTGDTMVIAAQKWGATEVAWDSMTVLTTSSSDELELNCAKTTTSGTPASADVYWKIKIPAAQETGSYTGQNTIAGYKGEAGDW